MVTQTVETTAMRWKPPAAMSAERAGEIVLSFLDTATTALGRSTAYNTKIEQQRAELAAHSMLLGLDRGLYALILTLPGTTDRARQVGLKNLLGHGRDGSQSVLDALAEGQVLRRLVDELPPQRVLKLFETLRVGSEEDGIRRANNARTRKLVLRVLLSSSRLELWAVKYRAKVARALTHAWGERKTGIVRAILAKEDAVWTAKERSILQKAIDRYAPLDAARVYACVGFVLGDAHWSTLPLLHAFEAAKRDLAAGAKLPPEVLEGIRSVFHRKTPKEEVLRLTAKNLTKTQALVVQKRAEEAHVEIRMNPEDHDAVRLYVYAFEMGMTPEIASALRGKARSAAKALPLRYDSVGILVDASASMLGGTDQRLRPMASVLALRDVLQHVGRATVVYAGGHADGELLVRPSGDTSLAEGLLDLVEARPEAIFVLSDGYENRPAGRFSDVVDALREIGITTPIYHLNPVFAAEAKGVRELCPALVPTLPANRPDALGLAFVRGMLQIEPLAGIGSLIGMTLPPLSGGA